MRKMMQLIIFIMAGLFFTGQVMAQDKLILSSGPKTKETEKVSKILKEAYNRIGIEVEIKYMPSARAITEANKGKVDGDTLRNIKANIQFPNLIPVPVALYEMKASVFTKDVEFPVKGFESLKPYKVDSIRGYKLFEKVMKSIGHTDYHLVSSAKVALRKLAAGRTQAAVLDHVEGLKVIKEEKLSGIKILEPPLLTLPLVHFLHKQHKDLVPKIQASLEALEKEGIIKKIWEG